MAVMDMILNAKDYASAEIKRMVTNLNAADDSLGALGDTSNKSKVNFNLMSIAVSGAAVALEALSRSQSDMSSKIQSVSDNTGLANTEIRNLASELSNARTPLIEVVELLELASKNGYTTSESMKEFAQTFSDVGLAAGISSSIIAEKSIVMRRLGTDLDDTESYMSAFGYMTDSTVSGVEGFLDIVGALGGELSSLDVDVNGSAALFGVLEKELGVTGSTAEQVFGQAFSDISSTLSSSEKGLESVTKKIDDMKVKMNGGLGEDKLGIYREELKKLNEEKQGYIEVLDQSSISLETLLTSMGISKEAYESELAAVEASSTSIEDRAKAVEDSITPMENFKSKIDDLVFSHAEELDALGNVSMIMMSAAPLVTAMTTVKGAYAVANNVAAVSVRGLDIAIKTLLGPIGWAMLAITGLVAGGVLLVNNLDSIKAGFSSTFGFIGDFVGGIVDGIETGFSNIGESWDTIWGNMKSAALSPLNFVIDIINMIIKGMNSISIDVPDWSPIGGGETIGVNISEIPRYHQGTLGADEGLALLKSGERVSPPGAYHSSNDNGVGSGQPLVINFNIDGRTITSQLMPEFVRVVRQAKGGV